MALSPETIALWAASQGQQQTPPASAPGTLNAGSFTISAPTPPSAAVPPQPLQNYSAADIAAANQQPAPVSQAPLQVPSGMRGHGAPASPYRVVDNTPLPEPVAPQQAAPAPAPAPAASPQQQAPQSLISPMVVRPAHEVRAVSPTTEKLYNEAEREKGNAADLGAMADVNANDIGAKGVQGIADTLASQQADMARREAERRARYDATQGEYERIRDEAAKGVVKPEQVGMMGHIAIALGAGGAALTHTPNFALEAINKRIDDNIAAQRANIENKNRSADRARLGLGEVRDRFGDERQADAAERARQLEQAKATGDALVARANSNVLAAKWDTVKAGLTEEQARLHNQMFPWQQAQVVGGVAQKPLENVFQNIDGQRYQARDPASRTKLTASAQSVEDIKSQIGDYTAALSQLGATDRGAAKLGYQTDAMSRAHTSYNHLMSAIRKQQDDGVWKRGETEMLANTLTPPDQFTGDPRAQMQAAMKGVADAHAHAMQIEDPLPVEQRFVQTPTQGVQPRNPYLGTTVAPQAAPASSFVKPLGSH